MKIDLLLWVLVYEASGHPIYLWILFQEKLSLSKQASEILKIG